MDWLIRGGKGGKEGDGGRGKVRRGRDKVGTMRCVKEMEGKNRIRKEMGTGGIRENKKGR